MPSEGRCFVPGTVGFDNPLRGNFTKWEPTFVIQWEKQTIDWRFRKELAAFHFFGRSAEARNQGAAKSYWPITILCSAVSVPRGCFYGIRD